MTSNHHAPYDLGYTRATMAVTKGSSLARVSKPQKCRLSSDCSLQLDYMKLESLVIADQNAAVNTFPGLNTPPVTPWESDMLKPVTQPQGGAVEGGADNWGEVVTR